MSVEKKNQEIPEMVTEITIQEQRSFEPNERGQICYAIKDDEAANLSTHGVSLGGPNKNLVWIGGSEILAKGTKCSFYTREYNNKLYINARANSAKHAKIVAQSMVSRTMERLGYSTAERTAYTATALGFNAKSSDDVDPTK